MDFEEFQAKAIDLMLKNTSSPEETCSESVLDKKLSDLNIDSLVFMEIIIELEDSLCIRLGEFDMSDDPIVCDFLEMLYTKIA